ncbi:MAG: FtsX-like permease family protein [Planctomycetales bacterium]|nr:FtsX-like permease family protein [Planctomycetales bacterium]
MSNLLRLIGKEARARWISFSLSVAATAAAVALYVFLAHTEAASSRETTRLMRNLGFNLRVIPSDTDMERFYRSGYSDRAMPSDTLDRLAGARDISYNHLVGVLQGEADASGASVLLIGISDEQAPPGMKKPPMVKAVERGHVEVGAEVARRLKLVEGGPLQIGDKTLQVSRVMPEMGVIDDLHVVGALSDVQEILGLPDQINEIKMIDCLCLASSENPRAILQEEVERTLPGTRVVMLSNIADARARQRQMSDRNAQLVLIATLLAAIAAIGALAALNVRQRASEIAMLRALGYRSPSIAALVLGRAALIGVAAAVIGATLGIWAAVALGPQVFQVTAKAIQPQWDLAGDSLWATPLLVMIASLGPAAMAVVQDPAVHLRGGGE